MPLDPRLILAQRPLESFADMQDRRTHREIQQQEVELRRQEIMARRDAIIEAQRQRNQPKPYDPVAAGHEYDLRVKQAAGVAALLEQATDPDTYEQAKQGIAQIVGPDYVQHLPPTYDKATNDRLVAQGKALIAKAQTEKATLQRIETLDDAGNPVQRFVTPTEGASYPIRPPAPSAAGRPVAIETVENGKRVRKFVMPTEGASYPVPESSGAGPVNPLVDVYNPVTKTRVLTPRSRAAGKTPGAAAPDSASGGPKLTGAQQEDIATMMTVSDLIDASQTLGEQTGWKGVGGMARGSAAQFGARNFGTGTPEEESLRENIGNIQGTIAKLRGGTAFSAQEKKMLDTYTPTINDSPKMLQSKFANLKNFIAIKQANTIKVARGDFSPTTPSPDAKKTGAPKVGDTKTFPNGRKGRWDGQGWELVP